MHTVPSLRLGGSQVSRVLGEYRHLVQLAVKQYPTKVELGEEFAAPVWLGPLASLTLANSLVIQVEDALLAVPVIGCIYIMSETSCI